MAGGALRSARLWNGRGAARFFLTWLVQTCLEQLIFLPHRLMCSSVFVSGQTDVEARAAEASQALVKGYIAWRTQLSSPGASIQAKEIARAGSLVKYNLSVSGLPTNQLYTLMSWPVGQPKPSPMMQGLSIGKNGIVMCAGTTPEQCGDSSQKGDPVPIWRSTLERANRIVSHWSRQMTGWLSSLCPIRSRGGIRVAL